MMRVINLAHGEFLMLGGYAAIVATNHGVNIWIAMLVVAPLVVGVIGVIARATIVIRVPLRPDDRHAARHLGVELVLHRARDHDLRHLGGRHSRARSGAWPSGGYNISVYRLVLIAITAAILGIIFILLRRTRLGLIARGTDGERGHGRRRWA